MATVQEPVSYGEPHFQTLPYYSSLLQHITEIGTFVKSYSGGAEPYRWVLSTLVSHNLTQTIEFHQYVDMENISSTHPTI